MTVLSVIVNFLRVLHTLRKNFQDTLLGQKWNHILVRLTDWFLTINFWLRLLSRQLYQSQKSRYTFSMLHKPHEKISSKRAPKPPKGEKTSFLTCWYPNFSYFRINNPVHTYLTIIKNELDSFFILFLIRLSSFCCYRSYDNEFDSCCARIRDLRWCSKLTRIFNWCFGLFIHIIIHIMLRKVAEGR